MRAWMLSLLGLLILGFMSLDVYGQHSLPDLARQERARRRANPVGSIRVYTNENIPRESGSAVQVTGRPTEAAAAPGAVDGAAEIDGKPRGAVETPRTEDEWRERFREARQELERAERRLALLEAERAELNKQLLTRDDIYNREYQLRPLIEEKEAELAAGRARVEAARQAIADLQDALRRAGVPAGWGRP